MSLNAHFLRSRYLIDDASLISQEDAQAYLTALFAIAAIDDLVAAEEALIVSYAETLGAADLVPAAREAAGGASLSSLILNLSDSHIRRCLFRDAVMVAHADGRVSTEEEAALSKLAAVLELTPTSAANIAAWVQDDIAHTRRLGEVLGG